MDKTKRFVNRLLKLVSKGRVDAAVREAFEYVGANPGDVWAAINAADILSNLGMFGEAREILEMLERRTPETTFVLVRILTVHLKAFDEALRVAEEAMREFGENPLVVASYAGVLWKMGRREEALRAIDSALERYPDDPFLLNTKAWIVMGEDLDEAERLARRALEVQKHHSLKGWGSLEFLLAEIMYRKQRYAEAEKWAKKAIEENPYHTSSYKILYDVYYGSLRFKDALKIADRLLRMNPANPDFLLLKGAALFALGKFDKALVYLDKALSINPRHFDSLETKGDILSLLGRVDEALEYYRRALEVEPNNPVVLSKIAEEFIEKGRLGEAEKYLEMAKRAEGAKYTMYWFARGDFFRAMGRAREAAECYKMAAKIDKSPLTQEIVKNKLRSLRG